MSYLIACRMPGCEWRTRQPAEYLASEGALFEHVMRAHTPRAVAEALISVWQYGSDGKRTESGDVLTFVSPPRAEEPFEPPPPAEPRQRRSGGKKAKYAKTYSQMVRDAFAEHPPDTVLTTRGIREYMGSVTKAIIPTASVSATLHKMCEDNEIEHVAQGQWKRLHGEAL